MQKISEKLFKVMEEVPAIGKDMRIKFKSTDYQARSEEAVILAIRPLFLKHKLMLIQTKSEGSRVGSITTLNTEYMIIDSESGEYLTLSSYGEGADTQDKGAGKAMTYALKNLLLKTFLVVSHEDTDNTSSDEVSEEIEKKESRDQKKRVEDGYKKTRDIIQRAPIGEDKKTQYYADAEQMAKNDDLDGLLVLYKRVIGEGKANAQSQDDIY